MTEIVKPIYCALAFSGMSLDLDSATKPCCGVNPRNFTSYFEKNLTSLSKKTNHIKLQDLRKSLINGIWHPACYTCRDAESHNVESMRTIWNRQFPDSPLVETVDPSNIKWLSISLGNKCNSKCITCGPGLSDFWIEEFDFIKNNVSFINKNSSYKQINYLSNDIIEEILNTFTGIEHLAFIGGEPTIIEEHYDLLKGLIKNDKSKNIRLSYVTNLTNINHEIFEIWKNFKSLTLSVSIDGYDKVNDYIRYPIKYEKVITNLKTYCEIRESSNFSLNISSTISIFNINEYADFLEFLVNFTKVTGLQKDINCTVFLNRVTFPNYFNLNILSLDYRKSGLHKIQALKQKINNLNLHKSFYDSCTLIESWCLEEQNTNTELLNKAREFIISSDTFRKRHINNYLPELWLELNKKHE